MSTSVKLPEGVQAQLDGNALVLSGKAGKARRAFDPRKVRVEVKGGEVLLQSDSIPLLNAFASHVRNMARGASEGYEVKMQMLHSHFPMSLEVKGRQLLIKNFLGEKKPRYAVLAGDTKADAKGQELKISGPNKEDVGQTVSNIRSALKLGKRDSRIFQDGLYVVEE
jgi:large subunit ribosomal protein L6